MSESDGERQGLSEDEVSGGEKLVPVSEAIRYRKRAQAAESQTEELQKQLEESASENKRLSEKLAGIETEHEMIEKLSAAGACDIEAAVVLAKSRMGEAGKADIDAVVEQLKADKGYLFEASEEAVVSKTAGVKEKQPGGRRALEGAAKRAAASGSRADVQEYLRVRRQFV